MTGREEVQVDLGRRLISSITSSWSYDRRDSALFPTKGYNVDLSTSIAGLGGDDRYVRLTTSGGYYTDVLRDEWILGVLASAGIIEGLGQDVSIYDRFLLGDRSFPRGSSTRASGRATWGPTAPAGSAGTSSRR